MKYSTILSIISILLLAGCLPQLKNIEVLSAQKSPYELYLYTELDHKEKAADYLSALLDWKTEHEGQQAPDFKQRKTSSNQINLGTDEFPALIIKKDGKVVTSIFGDIPREKILAEIKSTISTSQ